MMWRRDALLMNPGMESCVVISNACERSWFYSSRINNLLLLVPMLLRKNAYIRVIISLLDKSLLYG